MNAEGMIDVVDLHESLESVGKINVKSENDNVENKEKFNPFQIMSQY